MVGTDLGKLNAQVRLESGLRNNISITDSQIQTLLNEAYLDLRDRLITRFAYWFRSEVTFTLQGGSDNVFDLSTLPDFEMAQGLDLVTGSHSFFTVPFLSSYAERNAFNGTWPLAGQDWSYTGFVGRKYFIDGDRLEVLPAQNAGGTYRLVYTPIQTMAAPAPTSTIALDPADDAFNHDGYLAFDLANLTVTSAMLGGTVTVAYAAPNQKLNGTYAIDPATPVGSHFVYTTTVYPGIAWTGPASGTATIGQLSPGTIYLLPDKLTQFQEYLVLYASIAIKAMREEDVTALSLRFGPVKERLISLAKQRTEGVKQAPITQNRFNRTTGWGSGNGGF